MMYTKERPQKRKPGMAARKAQIRSSKHPTQSEDSILNPKRVPPVYLTENSGIEATFCDWTMFTANGKDEPSKF